MESDGEGPASLGHLHRPGAVAGGQFVSQLVHFPFSLGIDSKLILHGNLGQIFLDVLDFLSQVNLVLADVAGPVDQQLN